MRHRGRHPLKPKRKKEKEGDKKGIGGKKRENVEGNEGKKGEVQKKKKKMRMKKRKRRTKMMRKKRKRKMKEKSESESEVLKKFGQMNLCASSHCVAASIRECQCQTQIFSWLVLNWREALPPR